MKFRVAAGVVTLLLFASAAQAVDLGRPDVYDDAYDQSVSFTGDVRIIAQTVGVVLKGTGV